MIRVFVADDHAVVRRGVLQILEDVPDIVVAGEAGSGRETLRGVQETAPDVLLLDIAMPEGGGLEILAQVRSLRPELRVLILSVYPEKQYAVRALRAGAAGYLTKESAPEELVAAIRKAAQGGTYVSQSLAEKLAGELKGETSKEPHEALSDREYQVVRLLAAGRTVSEIAADLSLSVKTVSTYRARILEKMNAKSNADLTYYAIKNGLIE
jgi:DNA-binding NarL/FixJ family response regulator